MFENETISINGLSCKCTWNEMVTEGSPFACNLTRDAADSEHASAQLVASANGTNGTPRPPGRATVHCPVGSIRHPEPSALENSSAPREVGLLRAGRGTQVIHDPAAPQHGSAELPAVLA